MPDPLTWLETRDVNRGLLDAMRAGIPGDELQQAHAFLVGYLLADIDPALMREAVEAAIREHDRHVAAVAP